MADPIDDPDKTVLEKFGPEACDGAKMSAEQKKIRIRDIMRSSSQRFDPPDDPTGGKGKRLSDDDWKKIADACERWSGGWKYNPVGAQTCCCTFP
jgi:hypothetical protein